MILEITIDSSKSLYYLKNNYRSWIATIVLKARINSFLPCYSPDKKHSHTTDDTAAISYGLEDMQLPITIIPGYLGYVDSVGNTVADSV